MCLLYSLINPLEKKKNKLNMTIFISFSRRITKTSNFASSFPVHLLQKLRCTWSDTNTERQRLEARNLLPLYAPGRPGNWERLDAIKDAWSGQVQDTTWLDERGCCELNLYVLLLFSFLFFFLFFRHASLGYMEDKQTWFELHVIFFSSSFSIFFSDTISCHISSPCMEAS